MRVLLVTGVALAMLCGAAHAQMYRWVDKDGGVHYTQTPPPADAKSKQKMSGTGAGNSANSANPDLPYATQVAAKNSPVTLYTSPDCGAPCDQARAHLAKRGVPFKETSVQEQKDADEVKNLSGTPQVPLLVVGSQKLSGYLDEGYDSMLNAAGYPASAPSQPMESLRKMNAPPAAPTPPAAGSSQGAAASGDSGDQTK
jgi:glutaredoxin